MRGVVMASRTTQPAVDPWRDPVAAVDAERQRDQAERLDALRAYLHRRRDQRESDLRQLGVPEGAWHDVGLDAAVITDPTIEPFEGLQIIIACGGYEICTGTEKRPKVLHRVPLRAYQQWRRIGGPGDTLDGDRADWLAAEVWVINNLLTALDTGDLQHVSNLSRLLMVCEANWQWPGRFEEERDAERTAAGHKAGLARGKKQQSDKAKRDGTLRTEYLRAMFDMSPGGNAWRAEIQTDPRLWEPWEPDKIRSAEVVQKLAEWYGDKPSWIRERLKPGLTCDLYYALGCGQ